MNSNKLKGRIVEVFGTQAAFAEALGVPQRAVSQKLKNKRELTRTDIERWCELLKIEREDIADYFFTE